MTAGLETGFLIGGSSIIIMIISKFRWYYKHAADHPLGCGFTDTPIQDDNEIHIKTAIVTGVELLYVAKKHAEDDDIESTDEYIAKSNYCSIL